MMVFAGICKKPHIREALTPYERATSGNQSDDLRHLLAELKTKLDEPGKAAAAKLKVVLPLIPLIASYELELDTESFLTQVWQRIKGLFRGALPFPPL